MAELVADCPRCRATRIGFRVTDEMLIRSQYGWQNWWEVFAVCRNCMRSTVFVLAGDVNGDRDLRSKRPSEVEGVSLNNGFGVERYISLRDQATVAPPEHCPKPVADAFIEAATCLSLQCWNAAGAMFRLCIDLTTKTQLPSEDEGGPTGKIRRDLALRLLWMFDRGILPDSLRELATNIREDGNEAAHAGSLGKEDAEDLLDFTIALLERIFTEPERLKLARQRRSQRREK